MPTTRAPGAPQQSEQEAAPQSQPEAPMRVGAADDRFEVAADAAADRALRRLAETGELGAPSVRRASSGGGGGIGLAGGDLDGATADRIESSRGGGSSLPGSVRSSMEGAFGASFGDVRVHTGSDAADLNQRVGAQAFTVGNDIFLGGGTPDLGSREGQHLIAHELAHTQQEHGAAHRTVRRNPRIGNRSLSGFSAGEHTSTHEGDTHGKVNDLGGLVQEGSSSVGHISGGNDYSDNMSKASNAKAYGAQVGSDTDKNNMTYAGGGTAVFGLALDISKTVQLFMDSESTPQERAGAILGSLTSATGVASAMGSVAKTAEGGDAAKEVTKAASSVLSEIAGIMGSIKAGYELVKQIVELIIDADDLESNEKAGKSVAIVKTALEAGKGVIETINAFMSHLGTVTGPMLQAAPGIGIAMGALEIIASGISMGFAYVAYKEMQTDKRDVKVKLQGARETNKTRWGGVKSYKTEADEIIKAVAAGTATAEQTAKHADASAYMLSRNLQKIASKRIKRGVLNISTALPGIAGDIAILSGAGAAVGGGLKVAGSGAKVLAVGVRMGKQAYHNSKGDEKSEANKLKMYDGMISGMVKSVIAADTLPASTPEEQTTRGQAEKKALNQVLASGMTPARMNKNKAAAPKLYADWVKALKER